MPLQTNSTSRRLGKDEAGAYREVVTAGTWATTLPLNKIRTDGGTQPRTEVCDWYVEQLVAAIKGDAKVPAVDVFHDGREYWLADGFHRHAAHVQAGRGEITATVHQGTREGAQWFSYAANKGHDTAGLRRQPSDIQRAIRAALAHPNGNKASSRKLAEHIGCDQSYVARIRREADSTVDCPQSRERTGRDGRTINTAKIGKTRGKSAVPTSKRVRAEAPASMARINRSQREARAESAVKLMNELVAMVEKPYTQISPIDIRIKAKEAREAVCRLAARA